MAMHKPKKIKRLQDGGYLTTEDGKPVLDGSNQPIMTRSAPEEDEITARGRAQNAAMLKSFFNRVTGRGKEAAPAAAPAAAGPAAGTSSLRDPQQIAEQKAAPKFSDGDVDERDRRMEAAASAPSRAITSPSSSAPKPRVSKAPVSKPSSVGSAAMNDEARKRRSAAKSQSANYSNEGRSAAKKSADNYSNEGRGRPTPAAPEKRPGTALPINPGILKQREEAEKKREAARAVKRKAEEDEKKARPAKEAAERKMLSEQPGAVAYRKKQEERDKMSPGQRSAARGKAIKEFFGMAKGGSVSSASKRADGIAQRGKTRGKVY
jgi:hypothetical protein